MADCVGGRRKRGTELPLQTKPIPHCFTERLVELSLGTSQEAAMAKVADLLGNPAAYAKVPPPDMRRKRCDLTKEQTQHQIDVEMWALLTKEEISRIKGICNVFPLDEIWKDPPRARVITHSVTVNEDPEMAVKFDLLNQMIVRFIVHTATHAATADGKAAFNQYLYELEVGLYHVIFTPLGPCRALRCAMGGRSGSFISATILDTLTVGSESVARSYIDNQLLASSPDVLRRDIARLKERSDYARFTWNEDLSKPDEMIKTRVEFIGVVLDFEAKTVSLAKKVLGKLATVWDRQSEWSVRDFIICVCILVYTANVLGRRMSRWQRVLQLWARAQGQCFHDEGQLDASIELPPRVYELLAEWVAVTLENLDVPVPKPGEAHDFVLVTDACVDGWAGIVISCKTGQTTVVRGVWPVEHRAMMKHSTTSEPLAVAASVHTFFEHYASASVLHIGDNTATTGEVNKGYSTKEGRFLAEYLANDYPHLIVDSEYYPGEAIPTDELSRGMEMVHEKLDTLTKKHSLRVTSIREIRI